MCLKFACRYFQNIETFSFKGRNFFHLPFNIFQSDIFGRDGFLNCAPAECESKKMMFFVGWVGLTWIDEVGKTIYLLEGEQKQKQKIETSLSVSNRKRGNEKVKFVFSALVTR